MEPVPVCCYNGDILADREPAEKQLLSFIVHGAQELMAQAEITSQVVEKEFARLLFGPGESLFRRLLDKLPVGAYMCNPAGLITYFNLRAVELWGRKPKLYDAEDRFCGSFKLYLGDGRPVLHEECWMALAIRDEREYNGEKIIIERPDGSRITTLAHANPVYDDKGRLLGAVNVLVDISEGKQAQQALHQANEALERRIGERTAALVADGGALKREVEELKRAAARLQHLNQRVLEAEERDRRIISGELHESVGQMVTALLIELSMLRESTTEFDEALLDKLNALHELAAHIHDDVRFVSHLLRPPALEIIGLTAALYTLCQDYSKMYGVEISYEGATLPPLSERQLICLYRFVQEALTNAVHHAKPETIAVGLAFEDNLLTVTVEDDGIGFVPPDPDDALDNNSSVGLMRVRERLRLAGIDLQITSAPGAGARLVAVIYL